MGRYKDKVVVIPNGINIEDYKIPYSKEECRRKLGLPLDKNIVLFVGNLILYKGPNVLIRAIPKIVKKVPNTLFIFVGKGKMRNELEKLANKLGIRNHVRFTGFVEECLKPFYYKSADIFCLPSVMSTESFGIVNLEAMACGIPIVASRIGGVPDVIKDGENGLLVPPKYVNSLASSIIYLLENEGVRRKMGKNAKEIVKNFTWNKVAKMVRKLYKFVLSGEKVENYRSIFR